MIHGWDKVRGEHGSPELGCTMLPLGVGVLTKACRMSKGCLVKLAGSVFKAERPAPQGTEAGEAASKWAEGPVL